MKRILACALTGWLALSPPGSAQDVDVKAGVVYDCYRDGMRHYTSKKLPTDQNCRTITYTKNYPSARTGSPAGNSFMGYACKADCSGHKAGFAWASRKGISSPSNCTGNSQSFIEGCIAFVRTVNSSNGP